MSQLVGCAAAAAASWFRVGPPSTQLNATQRKRDATCETRRGDATRCHEKHLDGFRSASVCWQISDASAAKIRPKTEKTQKKFKRLNFSNKLKEGKNVQTKDKMFINWLTAKQFMWCDTKDSRTHLFFSFLSQFSSFPPSAPVWLISICKFWNSVCGNFFQILLRAVKHFASASRVQFVFCFVIGKSKIFILLLCFSHVYDLFPAHAHASETNRNDTKRTWNMHEKIVAS